jgi:hypothetical protein
MMHRHQAVGDLLAFAQDDKKWSLLGSEGNFFNGQGVYVLAEYRPPSGEVSVSMDGYWHENELRGECECRWVIVPKILSAR